MGKRNLWDLQGRSTCKIWDSDHCKDSFLLAPEGFSWKIQVGCIVWNSCWNPFSIFSDKCSRLISIHFLKELVEKIWLKIKAFEFSLPIHFINQEKIDVGHNIQCIWSFPGNIKPYPISDPNGYNLHLYPIQGIRISSFLRSHLYLNI